MSTQKKTSFTQIVLFVVAIVAALFLLRFGMSIAWSILKYAALGGLGIFVVYLFMSSNEDKKVEGSDKKKLRGP